MRESQMKKIIAAAVASAFVAPAFAADVTISGSQEFTWGDLNGVSTSEIDGTVKVGASSELPNGMSVSMSIPLSDEGGADGGANLALSGSFGTLTLGDVSSGSDTVDDVTDWGYAATAGSSDGTGTGASDANVAWSLPAMVEGLSVTLTASAQTQNGASSGGEAEATGYAIKYTAGMFTVGYGADDNDDGTSHTTVSGTVSMNGLTVAAEQFTDSSAANVDTDYKAMAAIYTMGDTTLAVAQEKGTSGSTVNYDRTVIGVHYAVGDVTFFAEQKDDSKDATDEATYFGASYKF
jgi:hypothetical protein